MGKSSEKAAKKQDFAGLDDKEAKHQLADLVNTTNAVVVEVALPNDPIADATMEVVITPPHPVNCIKRLNNKKEETANKNINDYCKSCQY